MQLQQQLLGNDSGGSPAATPATASAAVPAASPAVPPATDAKAPARIEVPTGTHIPARSAQCNFDAQRPAGRSGLFRDAVPGDGRWPRGDSRRHLHQRRSDRIEAPGTRERPRRVDGQADHDDPAERLHGELERLPGGAAGTGGGETMDKEGKVTGDSDKASDAGTIAKTTAAGAGIGAIASRSAARARASAPESARPWGWGQFCFRAGLKRNCRAVPRSTP